MKKLIFIGLVLVIAIVGVGIFFAKDTTVTVVQESAETLSTYTRADDRITESEFSIVYKEESKTSGGRIVSESTGTTTVSIKKGNVMREYDWVTNGFVNKIRVYLVNNTSVTCNFNSNQSQWICTDVTRAGGTAPGIAAAKQAIQDTDVAAYVWNNAVEKRIIIGRETACAFLPQGMGDNPTGVEGTYYACLTKDALQLFVEVKLDASFGNVYSKWEAVSYMPEVSDSMFIFPSQPIVY